MKGGDEKTEKHEEEEEDDDDEEVVVVVMNGKGVGKEVRRLSGMVNDFDFSDPDKHFI